MCDLDDGAIGKGYADGPAVPDHDPIHRRVAQDLKHSYRRCTCANDAGSQKKRVELRTLAVRSSQRNVSRDFDRSKARHSEGLFHINTMIGGEKEGVFIC